ncbi:hypothetical protein VD0002_g586 [Verticillium dahliae]|uniref:Necrosis-and ethylene-inducing protein-inducing protein n=2 Tax=Verticillium dahliae TaxID=27337 RepID=G2WZQ5_VERDV|nr:necrosis- and ethylene-inducing protein-inducing protein [Verticillium dahliae VdLs.17]KAF3346584.1 hypothetical protein VdG2_05244 [Verticillium dahliae VDG2]KAH6703901.1 necrosis and ethylene-inducing protein-inducing protein [Verticillium dahliae]EGY22057.1 necrosis- and ethylene-inducing protein-inducing protein [Verticillium dahliae VdLs.17]PNH29069.1 hypothetical protein BJF96_g7648 [Verticillium dahliae]PNH56182.1 hypothetical protein VD0003_g1541 [Verticillium dahliae]
MPSLRTASFSAVAALLLLPAVIATPLPDTPTTKLIRRDLRQPLGGSAWSEQEKWCPALDYDTDSCYNTVAISPSGQLNAGQDENKPAGEILGWCRKEVHLQQTNIYVRSRCNNGWCVHMYDYYFEADFGWGAHRHDWEHIAVWVQHGQLKFVSISQHGKWDIRILDGRTAAPRFEHGTHPKVVYHKDGALTHAFRWANDGDEPPENHWKSWRWGVGAGLIEWERMPDNLRKTLSAKNWGAAEMAVRDKDGSDWNFAWYINESQYFCWETYCPGFLAPEFKPWG